MSDDLPNLDWLLIGNEAANYAKPIEPSDIGGRKIAAGIFELIKFHDFSENRTRVFI